MWSGFTLGTKIGTCLSYLWFLAFEKLRNPFCAKSVSISPATFASKALKIIFVLNLLISIFLSQRNTSLLRFS